MRASLKSDGFKKKLRNLAALNTMFEQLATHTAYFVLAQMVDWELNFNPVRRITGNLSRSGYVISQAYTATLKMNTSQAPYALAVAKRVDSRYGKDYMMLALERVRDSLFKAIQTEFHRAVSIIEKGGTYNYQNPFYT